MKKLTLLCLLLASPALAAQNLKTVLKHGENVFATTCATGYCHATGGGAGGGASRLAARGFSQDYIRTTVTNGKANTAMPAFRTVLSPQNLAAVVAYVATLNGIQNPDIGTGASQAAAAQPAPLSAEAQAGQALFHDPVRGFGRCSTCHQVLGNGIPVAEPIHNVPDSVTALRRLKTPQVVTLMLDGDRMPALLVTHTPQRTVFYDLTVAPPVERSVYGKAPDTNDHSNWRHSDFIKAYTNDELQRILAFLREAMSRQ